MDKRFPKLQLCAACLPWTEDFQLDVPMFRKGVRHLCENGAGCVYLFGTAGEGYAVNQSQYLQIVTEFMDEMKSFPDVIPMVGVISMSMSEVMDRIRLAGDLGVRYFQISFPNWGAVTNEEVMVFFKSVCGAFPDYLFMHYNNAPRSRKRLAPADYKRLVEEVPNLVAVKFMAPSFAEIHTFASLDLPLRVYFLEFAYGYGSMVYDHFGYLASVANCSYKIMRAYYKAGIEKDWDTILKIHNDFPVVYSTLFANCPADKIDSSFDKLYLQFSIPEFPSRVLPPYVGCTDEQVEGFKAELRKKLPHWFE